jgi:putative aminopeptidase FrvX
MVERMTPLADHLSYDGLGSVIATQGSSGPRVMIDAHMDELGAVARRVTPDGFVTMQMLGGWLDEALVDQRWIILGAQGPVRATSGIRDAHPRQPRARKLINTRDMTTRISAASADRRDGWESEARSHRSRSSSRFLTDAKPLGEGPTTARGAVLF